MAAETTNAQARGTMRALAVRDFDSGPQVMDAPMPALGDDEVRVRVHAASINGFDVKVAAGAMQGGMEHRFPLIIGRDFAGVVDAIGSRVTDFAVGDRVYGVVTKPFVGEGSFGEYVTVSPAVGIAQLPASIEMEQAAALGLVGVTALQAIEAVAPEAGEAVLIGGATGGVGAFAIQMVAERRADAIATVKDDEDIEFVRSMGATHVVNYTKDLTSEVRALRPAGVDAVLHFAGDGADYADLLVPRGRIASAVGFGPEQAGERPIYTTSISSRATTERLNLLTAEVEAGHIRIPIARIYPLDEAPKAMEDFASGKNGKIVISML